MAAPGKNQAAEARIGRKYLQVFVAARMEAVFWAQRKCHLEVSESDIGVAFEGARNRQSILNVVLPGLKFIRLAKVLEGPFQISRIQTSNAQGIVVLSGFGSGGGTASALAAETQVQLCPFRHIASVIIYKLFKDFRSLVVILLVKSLQPGLKTPNRGLVGNIGVRPLWCRGGECLDPLGSLCGDTT